MIHNTILVEKKRLNEKKIKDVSNIYLSDNDLLYSLVDKAYYVDDIKYKIDNNLCVDNSDF
jgi:hypothetical protein